MPTETTVLVILDAFRHDYLNATDTPFLWQMAGNGLHVRKVTPNLGFCEISEYVTGTDPAHNGNFTQITYNGNSLPTAAVKRWKRLERIERGLKRRRIKGLKFFFYYPLWFFLPNKEMVQLRYEIPVHLLPFLRGTESAIRYTDWEAFRIPSLFDQMRSRGKSVFDLTFVRFNRVSGSDEQRITTAIDHAVQKHDLYLIYLGQGDSVGHEEGPDSVARHRMAAEQDRRIKRLHRGFKSVFDTVHWVISGDHGMVPVSQNVDVGAVIKAGAARYGLRIGIDFMLFLDSTMARVWYFSAYARSAFERILQHPLFGVTGQFVTRASAARYMIPAPGGRYGDTLWLADPGVMIYPDFFNRFPNKGMHGYDPQVDTQKGFAVSHSPLCGPKTIPRAELVDLCPTLAHLVGVKPPSASRGRDLMQMV